RFPETSAFGVKPISRQGSERLVRAACKYAVEHGRPSVTLVHKGNIMKYTEGGFRQWGYEVAETEFPGLEIKDVIADAFLQNTLLTPASYSVIATPNLNGDYISDQLAAMVGGIGISPGANINYETGHAVFEATHGTAPGIVGQGRANPSSLLLSATMMLEFIGWTEASAQITDVLAACYRNGIATPDLVQAGGHPLTTTEFKDEIIRRIETAEC
ncbi:MAG: isocitrate/isopropylmalate family dehydrogenase, partial [Propionibacteriaceae bacterium]|nr:isocitrate/isopropylmalate family dehydrogenase [Propionibacteriaceae bacterium]